MANTTTRSANLGFEAKLWLAADKLRNNMDAAKYKHVVPGLIFLKHISATFEDHHDMVPAGKVDFAGANPEERDEYVAAGVSWVTTEAHRSHLQASTRQPPVGKAVDDVLSRSERDNSWLTRAFRPTVTAEEWQAPSLGDPGAF
jgi:type I restriction enzyme M protein